MRILLSAFSLVLFSLEQWYCLSGIYTYRAETALYGSLSEFYRNTKKDGRMLLKEIFTSNADLIPDYQSGIMTIKLHSLSTPRANQAAKELCDLLNETQTCYPMTNLRMVYETIAESFTMVLEVRIYHMVI